MVGSFTVTLLGAFFNEACHHVDRLKMPTSLSVLVLLSVDVRWELRGRERCDEDGSLSLSVTIKASSTVVKLRIHSNFVIREVVFRNMALCCTRNVSSAVREDPIYSHDFYQCVVVDGRRARMIVQWWRGYPLNLEVYERKVRVDVESTKQSRCLNHQRRS